MDDKELKMIWDAYDNKLNNVLSLNKKIVVDLTKEKLNIAISGLYLPKIMALLIGIPYTIMLCFIAAIGVHLGAYFVAFGFGVIAIIMVLTVSAYLYHLYLVRQVKLSGDVVSTQHYLARLKVTSFDCLRLTIFQLPFWGICWMSVDAFLASPIKSTVVLLSVFFFLGYAAWWLFSQLSLKQKESKIRDFLLSGGEWEPIIKSSKILEQLKEHL